MTDAQDIEDDKMYFQSAIDGMRRLEAKCRERALVYSWIGPEPTWNPGFADYSFLIGGKDGKDMFPDPVNPGKRIIRLSLIGGGQIRTIEHFTHDGHFLWCTEIDLKITAHTDAGIVVVFGSQEGVHYEMSAQAVVLRGQHQDIANRAAATFRLINGKLENFYALLDGSEGCAICGRPLCDEISKLIGVGPGCSRKHGVPHNQEAAERRLALRRKLLHS